MIHLLFPPFDASRLRRAFVVASLLILNNLAHASPRKGIELDAKSASELSTAILRDNYDIWAEDMRKKDLVDLAPAFSSLDDQISALTNRESELSKEVQEKLTQIAFSGPADPAALRAALYLAVRAEGKRRKELLARALTLSQALFPSSTRTLELAVFYTTELLSVGDLQEASRMTKKILELAGQVSLSATPEACVARVVAGDTLYRRDEFETADKLYRAAERCFADGTVRTSYSSSSLSIRQAWTSFRLANYKDVLRFLEKSALDESSVRTFLNPRIADDASTMLGVALTEVNVPRPASQWLKFASRHEWVARGLARAVKYLNQQGKFTEALRSAEAIEASVMQTAAAEEFYRSAVEAADKGDAIAPQLEWRLRAIGAVRVGGVYARSIALRSDLDAQRRDVLINWVRDVASSFGNQLGGAIGQSKLLQLSRTVDALAAESIDFCRESTAIISAYRVFASANMVSYSERVSDLLRSCSLSVSVRNEMQLARIEMFQRMFKDEPRQSERWQRFYGEFVAAFSAVPTYSGFRRIGFEALSDSVEFAYFKEAEELLQKLYSSGEGSADEKQFERSALVGAAVKVLALAPEAATARLTAWLMLRDFSESMSALELPRKQLEWALFSAVIRDARSLRERGQMAQAVSLLAGAAEKMGMNSDAGRDLNVVVLNSACQGAVFDTCLRMAEVILGNSAFSEHERFLAASMSANVAWMQGRFKVAADLWAQGGEFALKTMRGDILNSATNDLVRAGDVYSELRLWEQSLRVRETLSQVTVATGQADTTESAAMSWSVRAIAAGAYDSAAEIGQAAVPSGRVVAGGVQKKSQNAVLFASLIAEFSRLKSEQASVSAIEDILFGFVSSPNVQSYVESFAPTVRQQVAGVLTHVYEQWWDDKMKESAKLFKGRSLNQVAQNMTQLRKNYSSLVRFCRLTGRPEVAFRDEQTCVSGVSENFVLMGTQLKLALGKMADGEAKAFRDVHTSLELATDEFRKGLSAVRAAQGAGVGRFVPYERSNGLATGLVEETRR